MRRWLVVIKCNGTEYRNTYESVNSKQALKLAWKKCISQEDEQNHDITVNITALAKKR